MSKLILIDGPTASGKSSTCYALRKKLKNFAFVDREAIKRLLKHSGRNDARILANKTVDFLIKNLMQLNKNILVQERNSDDLKKTIKKYGRKYKIYSFHLKCSLDEAVKRDIKRGDNTRFSIIKRDHLLSLTKEKDIIIDTEKNNLNKTVKIILNLIK